MLFATALALTTAALARPGTATPVNALSVDAALGVHRRGAAGGVLRPINVLAFEAAVGGLARRDETARFADLAPALQAQLVYGSPGADGQLLLANMTLVAPGGLAIVMLERLEGLTAAVDCDGADGALGVTWTSREAYAHALASWAWVNAAAAAEFLLIANHEGCGPQSERQAYRYVCCAERGGPVLTGAGSRMSRRTRPGSRPSWLRSRRRGRR